MGRGLSAEKADAVLKKEVADVCYQVLCDAGVYKLDEKGKEGLNRFLRSVFE